jgi:antitoxin (DNA-binding transcriptional repressor) of toxin-antitoxin stability system
LWSIYTEAVQVTVSEFRKNLFKLIEQAIAGESVEFVHRGTTIRLVVPKAQSRLDRLTPRTITNPRMAEKQKRAAERKLKAEMLAEMERDWSDL